MLTGNWKNLTVNYQLLMIMSYIFNNQLLLKYTLDADNYCAIIFTQFVIG